MFLDTCFELILVRDAYTSIYVPVLVYSLNQCKVQLTLKYILVEKIKLA